MALIKNRILKALRSIVTIAVSIVIVFSYFNMHAAASPALESGHSKKKLRLVSMSSEKLAELEDPELVRINVGPTGADIISCHSRSSTPLTSPRKFGSSPWSQRSTPMDKLVSDRSFSCSPRKSTSSGRSSSIVAIQQEEEACYKKLSSVHETQFQTAGMVMGEDSGWPYIIPNSDDKNSCGAAAVQMALNMLVDQGAIDQEQVPTFQTIVEKLNIKKNKSSSDIDIVNFLKKDLSLIVKLIYKRPKGPVIPNLDTIIAQSDKNPTIVLIHYGDDGDACGHFVLLKGASDDCFITISDPLLTAPMSYMPQNFFYDRCCSVIQIVGSSKLAVASVKASKSLAQPRSEVPIKPSVRSSSMVNMFQALSSDCNA